MATSLAAGSAAGLPSRATAFIGRGDVVSGLRDLVAGARVVTVTGPGGVGKTRVAIEAAEGLRSPDRRVVFVDLAPLDATGVERAVVVALSDAPVATLAEALTQPSHRPTLLLLDNCEHVLDEVARVVATMAEQSPTTSVLATSRAPLGISGERTWRLPPLPADDAVELFVDRARQHVHDLEVDATAMAAIARICERVDRLPLGVELAAAWAAALPAEQIVRELDDRLPPLDIAGERPPDPRHSTLNAALDWSFDLLDDAERALFIQLWVFAGPFHLEAVEAICGDALGRRETLIALRGLVVKSLVVVDRGTHQPWYRLLETVREYSRRRFDAVAAPSSRAAGPSDPAEAVLRRDEGGWLVGFTGRELRLGDLLGLRYLHVLLSRPGKEVSASDLAGRPAGGEGDTGPVIDDRARREYELRIRTLQQDVEEARDLHDVARAGRLEDELDQLVAHLSRAIRLGGQTRRTGVALEQDRSSVTKAVRAAIARIEAHEPALGRHLAVGVRTGTFCSYCPDGLAPLVWRL